MLRRVIVPAGQMDQLGFSGSCKVMRLAEQGYWRLDCPVRPVKNVFQRAGGVRLVGPQSALRAAGLRSQLGLLRGAGLRTVGRSFAYDHDVELAGPVDAFDAVELYVAGR